MSYVDVIRKKLKSMMDSNWPYIANKYFAGHNQRGNAMLATRPVKSVEWPAITVGPVTIRPMDARGTDKTTVNKHDDAVVIAPVTIRPVPTVFGTERECEAAELAARSGDGRWMCLCYTPDYLDWVGQQLDEMSAAVDKALSDGLFQCAYYKAVAAVLLLHPEDARPGDDDDDDVVDSQPSTDVVATTQSTTADNGDGFSARTPVDFDLVAESRLEWSGANYEIYGTYKTNGNDICTHEIIELVQKQLSALLRAEVCPEGSTRYVCNIDILTTSCAENKKTLVIEYSMTLNDMANIFTRIRTSKKGQNALYHQQIVAKLSNVLASNLKKILSTAQIVSKFTFAETRFEPDLDHMKINTFVSCTPGFELREVFCAACPLHHYSPDMATKCLKCPKGFHQPIAGLVKCVKCPTPFASGCYMDEVLAFNNYIVISASITFLILFVLVELLFCCCRKRK